MFEALKKYAVFSGRSRRKEFWLFMLLYIIVIVVAGVIDGVMGTLDVETGIGVFSGIVSLGLLIPSIAVSVRRLHDRNLRGWWLLVYFTGIGAIVIIIFFCMRGTVGGNRFGDDPIAGHLALGTSES